ncbi:hypothetical protein [Methylobacillus rhizosphaerae]|nr:hypothetical protein [Methylobacillus rhizosphaerae]
MTSVAARAVMGMTRASVMLSMTTAVWAESTAAAKQHGKYSNQ